MHTRLHLLIQQVFIELITWCPCTLKFNTKAIASNAYKAIYPCTLKFNTKVIASNACKDISADSAGRTYTRFSTEPFSQSQLTKLLAIWVPVHISVFALWGSWQSLKLTTVNQDCPIHIEKEDLNLSVIVSVTFNDSEGLALSLRVILRAAIVKRFTYQFSLNTTRSFTRCLFMWYGGTCLNPVLLFLEEFNPRNQQLKAFQVP
jgi:hypothetical protein